MQLILALTLVLCSSFSALATTPEAGHLVTAVSPLVGRYEEVQRLVNGNSAVLAKGEVHMQVVSPDSFIVQFPQFYILFRATDKAEEIRVLQVIPTEPGVSFHAHARVETKGDEISVSYDTLKDGNYFDPNTPKFEGLGEGQVIWKFLPKDGQMLSVYHLRSKQGIPYNRVVKYQRSLPAAK